MAMIESFNYSMSFISGPNGFHECLVTEVVSSLSYPDVRQHCSSDVTCQIIQGFAFIHENEIAHGGKN